MKKILVFTLILFAAFGCTKLDDTLYDRILPSDYTADQFENGPIMNLCAISWIGAAGGLSPGSYY